VPSIASDVNATLSITSSQWQQAPTSTPDSDSQSFAAYLDASTGTTEATTPPARPPQVAAQAPASAAPAPSPADAAQTPTTKTESSAAATQTSSLQGSTRSESGGMARANPTSGSSVATRSAPTASGDRNASGKSTAASTMPSAQNDGSTVTQTAGMVSAKATAGPGANGQSAASVAATTDNADGTAENAVVPPNTTPTTPTTPAAKPTKTAARDIRADANSDTSGTDDNTTAPVAATSPQTASNTQQPVAAAVAVDAAVNAGPALPGASDSSPAIGEETKAHTKTNGSAAVGEDVSSTQNATETATTKPPSTPAGTVTTGSARIASSEDTAKTQDRNGNATEQAPSASSASPSPIGTDAANTERTTAPPDGPPVIGTPSATATSSSNVQAANGGAKADVNGLPNFGFTASTTTPSTILSATPADNASAATVPIAGLPVAIAARAQAGSNQFEIRLSPPELGRIDVQLNVDGSGQVTSHITVDRSDTLQLLQSQLPHLQSALEQAGLTTSDNGLQFSLRDQSFAGQQNGSGHQSQTAQLVIPESDLAPVAATQIYARAGLGSGIDIRV
jgi:flagellar hook-length control protein FliK